MPNYNYKTKLGTIKAFAFDIDGVMTDGGVFATSDGDLLRVFDAKDGFAIRMCRMMGYPVGIITGGSSESLIKRCESIGVEKKNIYLKARNKIPFFEQFCSDNGIKPEEVAFVGDDIPDLGVLKVCGLAVCPSDAVAEVKEICDFVSYYSGGKGCIRDLVEQVLKVQNKWHFDAEHHAHWF